MLLFQTRSNGLNYFFLSDFLFNSMNITLGNHFVAIFCV